MTRERADRQAEQMRLLAARMFALNRDEAMPFDVRYKAIVIAEAAEDAACRWDQIAEKADG